MEENKTLTPGQKVVVDAYLAMYEPSETYNPERDSLIDTQTMIIEMGSMCELEENALCDYIASLGYHAHYVPSDSVSGWILRQK